MHTTLQKHPRVVLTGKGGVGKTAVAREYVRRFAQQYSCVCWLDMATDETLLADLFAALQALSLPATMTQGVAGLFQILQDHLFTQQRFLVILDNPSPPLQMHNFSEQQPMPGHVLLITREHRKLPDVPCLELDCLAEQDGALLVLSRAELLATNAPLEQAEEDQRLAALELARELRGWPIALNLAGGYIRATGCSVQDYLLSFRDCPTQLPLAISSENEDLAEVVVACELSLRQVEQTHPATLEPLKIAALLSSETLPAFLFAQASEQSAHADEESSDTQESVQSLLSAGLLTANQETMTLSMHPLVQQVIGQLFALEKPQQPVEQALLLFQQHLPTPGDETISVRLRIAGHIRSLAERGKAGSLAFGAAAEVFSWAAWLFWEQGLVGTAEPLLRKALAIWERTLGLAHPKIASVLDHLTTLNTLLKNYAEAEAFAHRAIERKSKVLGINHPDVLLALSHLAQVYSAQGKQREARLCYDKALSIGKRVELQRHAAYTTVKYDLALLLVEQAHFERAESLLQQVCLIWEKDLGKQHPSTMAARFSLAEVFTRLKKWERAETCYQRALPICEQLLGADHPVTLGHRERAALVLLRRGKRAEAERRLRQVLEIKERTSGVQHPDVATCLEGLAQVALQQGHLAEALAHLERAQSIITQQATAHDLILATILDTLASVEAAQQHSEQAILAAQRALDLRKHSLGEDHLGLVENLNNLAALYLAQGQLQQAETLLLQALALYQKVQKPEDLLLDPVLNSLAQIEKERQNLAKALMYLERLRAIRQLVLGQTNPRTLEVAQEITELARVQALSAEKM